MYTLASIQEKLGALNGFVEVLDESALHRGHAGYREGIVTHIKVKIESRSDITKIALHRLVYNILKEEIEQGLHAIAIESIAI
jgi:BolA protein